MSCHNFSFVVTVFTVTGSIDGSDKVSRVNNSINPCRQYRTRKTAEGLEIITAKLTVACFMLNGQCDSMLWLAFNASCFTGQPEKIYQDFKRFCYEGSMNWLQDVSSPVLPLTILPSCLKLCERGITNSWLKVLKFKIIKVD